jgi:hypothetical protein
MVDGIEEYIRLGESFINNTTCGAMKNDPDIEPTGVEVEQLTEREDKMATRMQDIIQLFLDILQVTGGYLEP